MAKCKCGGEICWFDSKTSLEVESLSADALLIQKVIGECDTCGCLYHGTFAGSLIEAKSLGRTLQQVY